MKHIYVPRYDGLSILEILDYGMGFRVVVDALPILRETKKMARQYVCNVIYTLVGKDFQKWVYERCQQRNEKLADDHNTAIQLDPRIAAAFEKSSFVS